MAARLSLFVPRFVGLTLIVLLATATLTFAAENRTAVVPTQQVAPAKSARAVLVVPDVRRQVYVFAKGTLEEGGFAWKVVGGVAGYSANRVLSQSPAPGTRVLDTGAPKISLSLSVNAGYAQEGEPENTSRFPGTAIVLADAAVNPVAVPKAKKAASKKKAAPKKKKKKKQAPAPKPKARPKAKTKPKAPSKPKRAGKRPPAFAVPGSPEPQDEIPLPERARRLGVWLSSHPSPSNENVRHWLYQHAWIVEGARLGWWRGAEALETLVRIDERVQARWEIGAKSEAVARAALAEVRAKSR